MKVDYRKFESESEAYSWLNSEYNCVESVISIYREFVPGVVSTSNDVVVWYNVKE